jgi:hypothetical protein
MKTIFVWFEHTPICSRKRDTCQVFTHLTLRIKFDRPYKSCCSDNFIKITTHAKWLTIPFYFAQNFTYSYLITFLLNYSLHEADSFLRSNPIVSLSKNSPHFYGTRWFITAFTNVIHLSLFWASSIQSMTPNATSWRPILILYSHPCLGLPSGLFPQVSRPKTCTRLSSPPYLLHDHKYRSSGFDQPNIIW